MICSKPPTEMLEGGALSYQSSTAELLDDRFMEQFEMVNPLDLQYLVETDDWIYDDNTVEFSLPQDELVLQEDLFLSDQHSSSGAGLHTNPEHLMSSEHAQDVFHQCLTTQDLTNCVGSSSDIQSIENLEQVIDVQEEIQCPQNPYSNAYGGADLDKNLLPPDLVQLHPQIDNLNEDVLNAMYGYDFNTDFQLADFEKLVDANPLFGDTLDQSIATGPEDSGLYYPSQVASYKSVNPALTWNGPVPDIEQPQAEQESLLQAPNPPRLSPPHNQHSQSDNKLPAPPRREKTRPKGREYKRRANIINMDPANFYEKLPQAPPSWQAQASTGNVTFQYNEYGNLCTNDRYTPSQILEYLYHKPLHPAHDSMNGKLTLWIQTVPADSVRRYPDKMSDKCRFADCPVPGGSIRKGFFRVAFDEHTGSGRQLDPYHCAGFVHLFCLERFCNFPDICRHLNVQPDQRIFDEGKNKMAVTRDHPEMAKVVRNFMQSSKRIDPWDYEQTLCFQLTSKHLELQCPTRQNKRVERGGNHIQLHKGDLEIFAAGEREKQERRRTAQAIPKPTKPATPDEPAERGKRKRGAHNEEERATRVENEPRFQDLPGKRARFS